MSELATPSAKPKRKRPPPRPVTVEAVKRLTPRVISVSFTGPALENFGPPRPGGHVKLMFAPPGWVPPPPDEENPGPRPPSRTYTPRRYDAANRRLDIEFVLHGDGLAANWVQSAKAGDPMHVAGPGGGFEFPPDLKDLVLIADDTAMPAAATILDALPASVTATVICEITDPREERPISARVTPQWVHYAASGAQPGVLLERRAVELAATKADAHWWIACEAAAMRRIRKALAERGVPPARMHVRGYWKLGETNYPDHDYGKD